MKSNGRTLIHIDCLLQLLDTQTQTHIHIHVLRLDTSWAVMSIPSGATSFLLLHHFKGLWTVMTQTVSLIGHNHYDSAHDPSLLTNIYSK